LGRALARHQAGEPLAPTAHAMFRRMTDDAISDRLGKRPLEVAADRIGRAAHAALKSLEDLHQILGRPVDLVWSPNELHQIGVIEVYPAATRIRSGWRAARGRSPASNHV
jgi:hypothetical protein